MSGGDREVLPHAEVVEQLGRLPGAGETAPGPGVGSEAGDVLPVDAHRAAVGHEPGDRVDEGRLARSVRPDQTHELSGLHFEVDLDDGSHTTERHGDAVRREHRGHGSAVTTDGCSGARRGSDAAAPAALAASAARFFSWRFR